MAATMRRLAPTLVAALVLLAAGFASATPDPAECPFELGYNPTFNASGTILSCTKGQETFEVDPGLILVRSLRGIGRSFQSIISGIIDGDLSVLGKFIEAGALVVVPDQAAPVPITDPLASKFITNFLVFPPGVDKTSVFDITNYHFVSNNDPRVATVHIKVVSAKATINLDTLWRFNLVNGARVWQLSSDSNLVVVPK